MKKKSTVAASVTPRERVSLLVERISADVYEKDHIIALALLCAIAGENIFLLGPPGTAKSMVAARLKDAFRDARSFDYLMSRFSTPDEIFGPVSISRLKEEDRYERLTEGYLPEADVVFLDEIWKAGPSIQNTLLTVINEHVFHNGGRTVPTPMKVLIAASNELPAPDEGLEALWDRFLVRMVSNCIESDSAFFKMIRGERRRRPEVPDDMLIDNELHARWQEQAASVSCQSAVTAAIRALRRTMAGLEKADSGKMRFYVSDRRWRKAYRLMQTSAFLNDRAEIDLSDFFLLIHCLWTDIEAIPAVIEAVTEAMTAELNLTLAAIERNIRLSMKGEAPATDSCNRKATAPNEKPEFAEFDYFYYKIDAATESDMYFSKWDYTTLTDSPRDGVRYFDTKRRRIMVRALIPGTTFDAAAQNATDVSRVKLRRSPSGIIINSVPYNFVTKGSSTPATDDSEPRTDLSAMPVYQRVDALKQTLADTVDRWNDSVKQTWHINPNIFLSSAERQLVEKALREADKLIKTTEVKLKNLSSML